jgi:competence protein ComEC
MNGRAIDRWLLGGTALAAGGIAAVAPWEVAAATAGVLVMARDRLAARLAWATVFVALVVIGGLRARRAMTLHEAERARADATLCAAPRCSAVGRVRSSPVRVRETLRWDAYLDGLVCEGAQTPWRGMATLYGGPDDLARGDVVEVVATIAAPQRLWNAAGGDPRPYEARRAIVRSGSALDLRVRERASGVIAWVDRARAHIRRRIDDTFPPDVGPMARALVLGESDLAADDDRSFRMSGLSHLLAVSGMHLVLVLAVAVRAVEAALARCEPIAARLDVGRLAAAAGIPVAWLYAQLAGAGGSTIRAAWMASAVLAARALGRRTDAVRAFGLSVGAMAALDPLVAFDASFSLSAAATGGLLAFASPVAAWLAARVPRWGAPGARAAATTIAASIPCVPILARLAPTVPLGGVVANLLAVPLGECAALPLCLAHALLAWWPAAERGCAAAASGALVAVRVVARAFAVPALAAEVPPPTSWQLAALAIALAALASHTRRRGAVAAACAAMVLLLEVAARRSGAPRGVLRATFLDVGQGDAAIVDLPDGQAIVIDGGGLVGSPLDVGSRVLAPALRARRRSAVTAAVLSHPHPDHYGGLATGLEGVRVGALWDTGEGEYEELGGAYASLLRALRGHGVPVLRPEALCGPHALGGASVDVLAPCPSFSPDRDPNDNSFVMRIAFGRRSILFVGDAERDEEQALLGTARDRLRADVLKVGHHGSRTSSSPAFVEAVAPHDAIVSAGCRNRFGHPHASTLATLRAAGARLWRTDREGAVVVTTDGESLETTSMAGGAR